MAVPPTDARQKILAAALELFAERGFAGTTTAAIAHRAGVAEKTLFAQFKNKELLFEQTLSPAVLELIAPDALASVVSTVAAPWTRLDDFLRALAKNRVEFAKANASKVKLLAHEVLLRPERFARFLERAGRDVWPRITKLFEHFERLGELRPMPPDAVLRMVLSVLGGYVLARVILMPDRDWDDDAEIERLVSVLVEGLRPAQGAKRAPASRASSPPPPRPRPRPRRRG